MFQQIPVAAFGTSAGAAAITGFTFNTSFNTSAEDTQPNKISPGSFSKLYVLGDQGNDINQYNPDGTYNNDSLGLDASSGYRGLSFDALYTGNIYVVEIAGSTYPLVTYLADLTSSTRTFLWNLPLKAGPDIRDFIWVPDLGHFYQLDIGNDAIYEVDTNGSFTSNLIDISGQSSNARGLTYDGSQFWVVDITNDEAYAYDYDGSTGAYTGNSVDISSYAGICVSITYNAPTDQFFLLNYDTNKTVAICDAVR